MGFDLILKGGRVIDPSQGLDRVADVAFAEGKVARVGDDLRGDVGTDLRDVSGFIVSPGLIDLHTHVYWGGTSLGIDAEEFCRTSGVTTAVDTGSAGPGNWPGFRRHVIERSAVRILAYLHVSFAGIYGFDRRVHVGESEDIRLMAPIDAAEVADANRDLIVGIKVRVGRHASGFQGTAPLQRGVLFDIGHGMGSFAFKTARAMLANGFAPDTISSDVHALCIHGPAFDQVTTMSKFLCLGMPLVEVIERSTVNAAMALKRPELGSLKPGSAGDATVLSVEEERFDYVDAVGEVLEGRQRIESRGVVLHGRWWHPDPFPNG